MLGGGPLNLQYIDKHNAAVYVMMDNVYAAAGMNKEIESV